MDPKESLLDGDLSTTLANLQQQVRSHAADAKQRTFLFQLLAVMGDWDRAMNQLDVAGQLDASTLAMVHTYRRVLQCERVRDSVFRGRSSPLIFGEPKPWLAWLIESLKQAAEGRHGDAVKLRAQAFEEAVVTSGAVTVDSKNGEMDAVAPKPFQWIADADQRLGPVLEAVVNGRYYWIPFENIRRISLEKPHDLRDLVWLPVAFEWLNGGQSVGLIPSRYPGSESSEDDLIRLGRKTQWYQNSAGVYEGLGQRMLTTDQDEYALFDIRQIHLNTDQSQAAETAKPAAQSETPHG